MEPKFKRAIIGPGIVSVLSIGAMFYAQSHARNTFWVPALFVTFVVALLLMVVVVCVEATLTAPKEPAATSREW